MAHTDYPNGGAPWDRERKKKVLIGFLIASAIIITIIIIVVLCTVDKKQPTFQGRNVLDNVPLFDGSNQVAEKLRLCVDNNLDLLRFDQNLTKNLIWGEDENCNLQTDITRLQNGKVSGLLFVASAPCSTQFKDAAAWALEQVDVLKRLFRKYPKNLQLAKSSLDLNIAYDQNKIACFLALNGGHAIDSRVALIRTYYELGVRVMALAPECNTPWIQSRKNNETVHYGEFTRDISDWGRLLVREMNRLGMIIDMTGASFVAVKAVIETSKAPIILTQIFLESNLSIPLSILKLIGANNGLVMLSLDSKALVSKGAATMENLVDQIDYLAGVVGINNIGLGSGFGNIKIPIKNFPDVSGYPNLFDQLYLKTNGKIKWNQDNLSKLASGNFLRVLQQVEQISISEQGKEFSNWISYNELNASSSQAFICRSANADNGGPVTTTVPSTTATNTISSSTVDSTSIVTSTIAGSTTSIVTTTTKINTISPSTIDSTSIISTSTDSTTETTESSTPTSTTITTETTRSPNPGMIISVD